MNRVVLAATDEALQGSLRDFPLPALLRTLAGANRTGVLQLEGGDEIWLSDGRLYLATSPNAASVATVLSSAGAGSEAYINSLAGARTASSPSILNMVLGTEPQLAQRVARTLYEYNLNAVFELLIPSDVGFFFQPGDSHPLGAELSHDTESLVARAEQRMEIWREIAEQVPSTAAVYRLTPSLPADATSREISAEDWRYLSLVDGHRTVADLVSATGASAFQVCSTIYRFLLEGLIEAVPDRY